ncbi:MAG: Trk system potassium transporter TrkA [Coprococcus sp.]
MKHIKAPRQNGLKIIIVGCGKVGAAILKQLCNEGHDITIIDKNPQKVSMYANLYDVMGIIGNGASHSVQMEAGIENTDLIISVTDSDELNILCCTIAKQVGDCAAIARVRNPEYSREVGYLREKLGLTMIMNPELATAAEIARVLYLPTALEVNSFAHGGAEMVKFKIPEKNLLAGISIAELGKHLSFKTNPINILICAVERDGQVYIPSGDFVMRPYDVVSFVSTRDMSKAFMEYIGFKTARVKNTMIVGGGDVAYYLAKQLINMGIEVKIIERDETRCEELSVLLPKAVIIHGDGTNQELLKEEGLGYAESFVPLTGIDEENILLTLHAKQHSNAKTITKINRSNFKEVISNLELGSVVYPSNITAETIIAYVRAKKNSESSNIETLYHMFDSRVEAIEFRVDEASTVTGIQLKNMKLKKNLLITFINRNGSIILPSGQDDIMAGDTVMIVTTHTGFKDITDILKK